MKLWVFSDLHLEESTLYHEFLSLLEVGVARGDQVVFAGDIFDLFVGNSTYFKLKFKSFFDILKVLNSRGVVPHYIFGNHDFNLDHAFEGLQIGLHDERVTIEVPAPDGRKKIYVAHGDLIDPSDVNYIRMRKLFRSAPARILSSSLPGTWIEKFGRMISRKSDQKMADLPESWSAERRDHLRRLFREFAYVKNRQGFDYVILGHCHDLDEQEPFYFNMGYPPVHRQFLLYDSEIGRVQRHKFPGIPRKN
ncbi:MAG: UDP-2,3-diacylglucosamine diphosphatase [Bdellovibrionales bacterium]|nr:UDP-2,3-diacylglucosamine diphosphatase [Bdellovibrionales bacterium]